MEHHQSNSPYIEANSSNSSNSNSNSNMDNGKIMQRSGLVPVPMVLSGDNDNDNETTNSNSNSNINIAHHHEYDSRQERPSVDFAQANTIQPDTDQQQQEEDNNNKNNNNNNTSHLSIRRQLPSLSPAGNDRGTTKIAATDSLSIPDLSESASSSALEEKWVLSRSLAWSQDSMDHHRQWSPFVIAAANVRYQFQRNHSIIIDNNNNNHSNVSGNLDISAGEVSPTSTCLYWEEKLEHSVPFPEY